MNISEYVVPRIKNKRKKNKIKAHGTLSFETAFAIIGQRPVLATWRIYATCSLIEVFQAECEIL